jgi:hypothetical protein
MATNRLAMNTETLLLLKLISDAGLLVLIWLVQLVIYPGFAYYIPSNLKKWHSIYTGKVTIVVLPLMLSQLILSCWLVIMQNWDLILTISAILVIFTWLSTFMIFVPLHQKIDQSTQDSSEYTRQLVNKNWLRTILWTTIFLLSLIKVLL